MKPREITPPDEPKLTGGSEIVWSGQMTCMAANLTQYNFTEVLIVHASSYAPGGQDRIKHGSFNTGDIFSFDINVGWQGYDHWYFYLYIDGKIVLNRENKICNVKEEDFDSGLPVFLIFYPEKDGFTVQFPASTSCILNGYGYSP